MTLLYYLKYNRWGGGPNPPEHDPDVKRKKNEEVELQAIFNLRKSKKEKLDRKKRRQKEEDLLLMMGEFDA